MLEKWVCVDVDYLCGFGMFGWFWWNNWGRLRDSRATFSANNPPMFSLGLSGGGKCPRGVSVVRVKFHIERVRGR